jgi:hypothetical protein
MGVRKLLVVSLTLLALVVAIRAQTTTDGGRIEQINVGGTPLISPADAVKPVPRLPDGHVDLTGPWVGGGSNADIERDGGLKSGELPLLPWAKKLRDSRKAENEPYTACLPMSVPRVNPYPWKFAMTYTSRGLSHIYVLHETGDAGAHRVIYMDGRGHPADPIPTWWGHSIGWWEGDTLVVDTVGYNDKFWFDSRGTPHSDQLHTIERFTTPNFGTLLNEFTLDDPGAFSRPVHLNFVGRHIRADISDLMEFVCLEDNQYGAAAGFRPAQPDR